MIYKKQDMKINLSKLTTDKLGTIATLVAYLIFMFFVYSGKEQINFIDIPFFSIDTLPLYIVLLIVVALFLFSMLVKKLRVDAVAWVLFMINALYLIALPFTARSDTFDVNIASSLLWFVFYLFGRNYAQDSRYVIKVIRIIFFIICLQVIAEAAMGTESYFGNTYLYKQDLIVPLAASNSLASKIIPCFVFLISAESNKKKIAIYILLALISVGLTKSRSGLILLVVAFSLVISLKSKITAKTFIKLIITLFVFAIIALLLIKDAEIGRYIFSGNDSTVIGRINLWNQGLSIFWDNPILGMGIGLEAHLNPHNFIIQILMTSGIMGIILFTILGTLIVFEIKKYANDIFIKACFCFVLCMVFQGLVEDVMLTYVNGIILWFVIGNMMYRVKQLSLNENDRRKDEDGSIYKSN